jgi:threonine/homoserine/homoserine lactone efflux protein
MNIAILLTVVLAFWVVAASPGPANISNAAIAMHYGRKPSLIYGLGLSVALVFWGVLAATGMGALLQATAGALLVLKLIGGCYLLWLAWQTGKSAAKPGVEPVNQIAPGRWFWRGMALNLSNPKSVIAWMAALSMGLDPNGSLTSVILTTLVCIVVAFLNNFLYTLIFSMGGMMQAYRRFRRWIDGISAALFTFAGFALIRSAFSR